MAGNLGLISNPLLTYGAYNKALFLNGTFRFIPLTSQATADTFFVALGKPTGGSDTAGYNLTTPVSGFNAGTMTEFTSLTFPGYARYPLGSATQAGTGANLTLNRTGVNVSGVYTTWAASEVAFTAVFTNTNVAGGANWDLSNTYALVINQAGNLLCYAAVGQAGDVLSPQSSLNFNFPIETTTSAILFIS